MINKTATVFVVDDEERMCQSLRWLITSVNLHVATFDSARAFLTAYRPSMPGCLVLDIRMPEMSGLELMEELQERGIALPIIFLSAHGDVPMAVRAIKSGALDFLQKPFNSQEFLDRINQALKIDACMRANQTNNDRLLQGVTTLSSREREILELVVLGESSKSIGQKLGISHKTVEVHRAHIMRKLEVRSFNEVIGKLLGDKIVSALQSKGD
jgi:FixJ family two-component response regulator